MNMTTRSKFETSRVKITADVQRGDQFVTYYIHHSHRGVTESELASLVYGCERFPLHLACRNMAVYSLKCKTNIGSKAHFHLVLERQYREQCDSGRISVPSLKWPHSYFGAAAYHGSYRGLYQGHLWVRNEASRVRFIVHHSSKTKYDLF